ncbi:S9 family peptidase [Oceanihabitans sp. IOP_32]|uniref:S9 family peptidase n=1 Tax=Oceanihabitans sp. IOP_32 TaxID=2529032 RepID=UPI0012932C2B|nr:S9 family peptidase [Oceanihabitans sp. IOP_32]QFZ53409.1 S9 family peptidase [Oceanihabitans sp. IOP_32]
MKHSIYTLLILTIMISSCKSNDTERPHLSLEAPVAKKIPKELTVHDDTRIDNYFWMRLSDEQKNAETPDAQTQDVLDYLNAENDYLSKAMAHTTELQDKLYNEIVGRIKKDDQSVPVNDNGYSYYTRFEEGDDYALYCRKKLEEGAQEEIMLNGPEMAKGHAYYGFGGRSVSPNNKMLAFAIDTVSRRQYTIYFKNLETGELLEDKLSNTGGSATWANDGKTVFYTTKDPQTLRQNKIVKHVIGTDQSEDVVVYEEKDDTFRCGVGKTKSDAYLVIGSFQTLSTEFRVLDANTPDGEWKVIQPREKNLEYTLDHFEDHFYIRTNKDAKNFKLVKTPVNKTEKEHWVDVIPHRENVFFQGMDLFQNYLVAEERKEGLRTIRVMKWDGTDDHYIQFNDPAYFAATTSNLDFDTDVLRFMYSSLTTPMSTFEYNMTDKSQELLKQTEVVDDAFKVENYTSERLFATATDGTKVPVSLVYKKGVEKNGKNPLLLYAYGSYGNSMEPTFSSTRLSLLDRGFIYAIAHIRGGQEMGRDWYEDGKLLKKKNTFTDFIDVGQFLIDENFTNSNQLYAYGGSAGGLLMGAVLNMQSDMWNGVVAAVPFVDVVSTMLDETIPLTTFEFDEWGNPKNKEYYNYMKSYSPYDNVEAKDYPNILITTGYWDSQVQYWEPAKWIAKLRELKTDDNLLIMECNMETGHGGASGRFERYKTQALTYAFLLDLEGIKE